MGSIWNNSIRGLPAVAVLCLKIAWSRLWTKVFSAIHKANFAECGRHVVLSPGLMYRNPRQIRVGSDVFVDRRVSFSTEASKGNLTIGTGSTIGFDCFVDFTGDVHIGEKVRIASEVYIMTHTHGYDHTAPAIGIPLDIDDHAFIGARSVIMYGCRRIGKYAVVGVGSVVTKDVPDYAVVAGNPARIIKYIDNELQE